MLRFARPAVVLVLASALAAAILVALVVYLVVWSVPELPDMNQHSVDAIVTSLR